MSDLDRFIEWVNGLRGIGSEQKKALRELARSAATRDGRFGPRDREVLVREYEKQTGQKWSDGGYDWSSGAGSGGGTGGGSGNGPSTAPVSGGPQPPSTAPVSGGPQPARPGAAWVWSAAKGKWVKPPAPGDGTHTWDDERGWVARPNRPGDAWVWQGNGGVGDWKQPPMPTDGQTYTWDDNRGWVPGGSGGDGEDAGDAGDGGDGGDGGDDGDPLPGTPESRESASAFFRGLLAQFGFNAGDVDGLMGLFDEWIAEGFDNDAIMMKFRGTDIYARRFPGMSALSQRGQAITEGEYIRLEGAYRANLSRYGLPKEFYDSPDDYGMFIANGVSPDEVDERAATGMRLLQSADRRILDELGEYYGVSQGTALAYLLDANKGQDLIRRQMRAATIGGSGERFGFKMGRAFSEEMAGTSLGQTIDAMTPDAAARLDQSFSTARKVADRERVLSDIDSERFQDVDAVDAMFGDLDKQLASQRRARRERARFAGTAGVGASSLSQERNL